MSNILLGFIIWKYILQKWKWYQNNLVASERNHVVRNFIVWFDLFSLKIACYSENRGSLRFFISSALCQTIQSISKIKCLKKRES